MDELDDLKVNIAGDERMLIVGGWRPQAHVHDERPELERDLVEGRRWGIGGRADMTHNQYEVNRLLREFDWMPRGRRTMTAHVLDGNMYMASEWAAATRMGAGVVYSDDQGVRHRGVMLHKTMLNRSGELGADLPVRLWSPEMIGNFLCHLWRNAEARAATMRPDVGDPATAQPAFDPAILVSAAEAGFHEVAEEGAGETGVELDADLPEAERRRVERGEILRRWVPENGPAQTYFFNTDLRVAMRGVGGARAAEEKKPIVALRPGDCLMLSVPKVDAHRIDRALKAEAKRAFAAAHPQSRTYTPEQLTQAKAEFLWPELRGGGAKKGSRGAKGMAAIRIPVRDQIQLRRAAEMIARAAGIELYLVRGSSLGNFAQAVQEEHFEEKKSALRDRLAHIREASLRYAAASPDQGSDEVVEATESGTESEQDDESQALIPAP
jgi:hypothetical protein